MTIRVRIAEPADQGRLIEFIHDHWSATHVFTKRPELFAWQYLQPDGRLNMVLAEDMGVPSRGVLGVLGFIPMGRFAPTLGDADVMLAIWKVREDEVPPGLGLRLLKYLQRELSPRLIAAIGTSSYVRPIYEALRYQVGALHQSAVFHPHRSGSLRIASGVPLEAFEPAGVVPSTLLELVPLDQVAPDQRRALGDRLARGTLPAKSWDYLERRYLAHPWYHYEVRLVRRAGDVVAVVVWREVSANGARVLRVVDIVGDTDWLRDSRYALQREVMQVDAEYVDLLQWGIDTAVLRDGGFVSTDLFPDLVLPNYFAPFEARNVQVELAFKVLDGSEQTVQLFRADSDQDRPNLVSELGPRS